MDRLASSISALIVTVTLVSCGQRSVKSDNFAFEVRTWGMPGSVSFESFMYNTDLATYPDRRRGSTMYKENILYVLRHDNHDSIRVTDTLKLTLDSDQVDSLYNLSYTFLSNFTIDNSVDPNHIHETISEGGNIYVSLNYDGKLIECSQYRLRTISDASDGADDLIEFINSKVPERFRLY